MYPNCPKFLLELYVFSFTKIHFGNHHYYTESGNIKNGDKGVKVIPLNDEAIMLIRRYRAERPNSKLIFPNAAGNRISNNPEIS